MAFPYAPYLMRAFRTIDSSFHFWRAGEFDDDMSETTPPNPVVDYSDFTVVSYIGGNLAISDSVGTDVLGTGTVSIVLSAAFQSATKISVRNFNEIEWFVHVSNYGLGPVTQLDLEIQFSEKATPGSTDWAFLTTEVVTAGNAVKSDFTAMFDTTGGPATIAISTPVRGQVMRLRVKAAVGDPTNSLFYVTAYRRV